MALPFTFNPNAVQPGDSPGLGPQDFQSLWQALVDALGVPASTPISGALMSVGTNTDGRLALLPVARAATPYQRLIGTEASGADVRLVEDASLVSLDKNSAADPAMTWLKLWGFDVSVVTKLARFTQANTADRVYTMPDKDGTVAMLADAALFPVGTRIGFFQAAVPLGWTRVVDAGNTDALVRVLLNSEVPAAGGSWTVSGLTFTGSAMATHQHESPAAFDNSSGRSGSEAFFGTGAAVGAHTVYNAGNATDGDGFFPLTSAVSAGTPAGTIASDATWRPKYVSQIVGEKA
jgi:hypothetical protein